LCWAIKPLTRMFVDVLTRVTELVRMEAKARGRSRREGLTRARAAIPTVTGRKKAVVAVLLMNADNPAAASMINTGRRCGLVPARRRIARPAMSTTPVRCSAAVRIKRPRMTITVSLPKPAKARSAGTRPVRISASTVPNATTSVGTNSTENSARAAPRTISSRIIGQVMRSVLLSVAGTGLLRRLRERDGMIYPKGGCP